MAKITSKANLLLGTNLFLHVVEKNGTDISVTKAGEVITLASTTTDFVATSTTSGIVSRGIVIGDTIKLARTTNAANEQLEILVTAAGANEVVGTIVTGVGATEIAGSSINITGFKKTYEFVEAGALDFIDGVSGIILNSVLVDLWDTQDLDRFLAPFNSIEPRAKSIASINGWEPHNLSTTNAIRDTALEIRPTQTAAPTQIYCLPRSTSDCHAPTDQITLWPASQAEIDAPLEFVMTGYANQLIKIYDSVEAIDLRGTWYTRLAEEGKTIIMEQHLFNYAEIYPISAANGIDPKLIALDGSVGAGGVWANVDYFLALSEEYLGDVDGIDYTFRGYVEGDGRTNEIVHEKLNYLWRQPTNINSDGTGPVLRGDKQWPISEFSGDAFSVNAYLLNYNPAQRNNLTLFDVGSVARRWPAIYAITVVSPAITLGGTMSVIHENTVGTNTPVYLVDEDAVSIKDLSIIASRGIIVAYSTYNNGGHTPNQPINLRLTWNRPGFVEPGSSLFTLGAANQTVAITPTADPSYTVA